MAGIQVNTLNNANIYIDGNSLLGQAEEFKLPVVKFKMAEHKAVGMVGAIKLPSGFEALEGEIKWNSFYANVWPKLLDPFTPVQLQARGSLETYTSPGERGSGVICLNGAAARLVQKGDIVIIMSYVLMSNEEAKNHEPKVVLVNEQNKIRGIIHYEPPHTVL